MVQCFYRPETLDKVVKSTCNLSLLHLLQKKFQDECRNVFKLVLDKQLLSLKFNIQACPVFSDVHQKCQITQSDIKDFISLTRDQKRNNVATLLSQRTWLK